MKIDEARDKILAIFSDTLSQTARGDEVPEGFMMDFIENMVAVCGPQFVRDDYDRQEIINCLETLKQSIDAYRKTTTNIGSITDTQLQELGVLIETEQKSEPIRHAATRLRSIQKNLKDEIVTADNAIQLFQEQVDTIRKVSRFDHVTKLLNAHSFVDDMIPVLKIGARRDLDLSVIMLQLDNYDAIIDEHGTEVYNKILVYVTRVLRSYVRSENKVYRYNPNTFLIVLNRSKAEESEQTRTRIVGQITKNSVEYNKRPVHLSLCVATEPHRKSDTINTLLKRLEEAKVCVEVD